MERHALLNGLISVTIVHSDLSAAVLINVILSNVVLLIAECHFAKCCDAWNSDYSHDIYSLLSLRH
jgi:hypothetical protein